MPKKIIPLSEFEVKNAKYGTKNTLFDGDGLYLLSVSYTHLTLPTKRIV